MKFKFLVYLFERRHFSHFWTNYDPSCSGGEGRIYFPLHLPSDTI